MIVKRGSSYGVSVYDPALKRKRWIGTFETLREAREAERAAGRRRGSAARLTCGEFVRLWQENYARPAPATRRTYRYALRQFEADFGHLRLTELDRLVARPWALTQPQSNVRAVRAMLNDAINDGLHPGPNPFANLRLEQPRGRKDLDALSEEELQTLAGCARTVHEDYGPTFQAMVIFAAYVGLRRRAIRAAPWGCGPGRGRHPPEPRRHRPAQAPEERQGARRDSAAAGEGRSSRSGAKGRCSVVVRHAERAAVSEEQPSLLLEPRPGCVRSPRDGLL
jgi:hypothetical protein